MTIADILKNIKERLLGQKTVSQYGPDPNNKYACLFTCYYMFLQSVCGYKKSWSDYKRECVRAGALREDFYVLNHDKMLTAAGVTNYKTRKVTTDLQREIVQSILNGRPVICSLNGEHWVSIDGWLHKNGVMLFTIDDPARARQNVFCAWDLKPYSETEGKKEYQYKRGSRDKREITSIVLIEKL